MRRTSIIEHGRRTDEEAAHDIVPHHPACGCEPKEPIAGSQIVMERKCLQVLEQDSTLRVNEWFWKPSRPGLVENPQWMFERDLLEFKLRAFILLLVL